MARQATSPDVSCVEWPASDQTTEPSAALSATVARETLELVLPAAVQRLVLAQRTVLILRDVLAGRWPPRLET